VEKLKDSPLAETARRSIQRLEQRATLAAAGSASGSPAVGLRPARPALPTPVPGQEPVAAPKPPSEGEAQ
jgi:hypothetical protein